MYQLDLSRGVPGGLPEGWALCDFGAKGAPRIGLKTGAEGPYLSLAGGGDPLGNAYISTGVRLEPGTYSFQARFSFSPGLNPQRNLLFQCRGDSHDGIFKFFKLDNGMVEGRDTIVISGEREETQLRIYYRFSAGGEVKLYSLSLLPTEPVKPRWARFACTSGNLNREQVVMAAARAAGDGADLLLYPEVVTQNGEDDAPKGEAVQALLAEQAAKHRIYTAGSAWVVDREDGHIYNRGVLFDRQGRTAGVYDKIHPYCPENTDKNVCPGNKTGIFKTDFGKVGMIICYDSWFTDVTALLALKGAELILFPVAGYYRSLIPARAADNRVRFVISVSYKEDRCGIFDTAGRDVEDPGKDPTVRIRAGAETFKDVRTFDVDGVKLLCASLDLNCSISPHYNGGRMREAPGGKRCRDGQVLYLEDMIKAEKERWWEENL